MRINGWNVKRLVRVGVSAAAIAGGSVMVGGLASCGSEKQVAPIPSRVAPLRDVDPLLRGTVGAEVTFLGIEPVLVSGYGLVVGLNGTGGDVLPDSITSTMEREMGLLGIGKAGMFTGTALEGKSPRQLLMDKNVCVVLVQAAIPPGAPAGASFDVYVRAMNASSLDGGTLWTTELRVGDANTFGQIQTRSIAKAKGPIFINPFAESGRDDTGVTRTTGRVLDGGAVTNPMQIEMVLSTPSFQLVRSITSAINSRFPEGSGDPGPTARGRSGPNEDSGLGGSIALRVPTRYRKNPGDFLQLVRHIRIDQSVPQEYARRYVEGVKAEPVMADSVAWALEALGQKALPFVRELYEYPELVPRLAGLRAGARLDDARAAPYLKEMAINGQDSLRGSVITLLGEIDGGPMVDNALKELLNEKNLVIRVAAYEALAKRSEIVQFNRLSATARSVRQRGGSGYTPTQLEMLSEIAFPGNTLQGIERRLVEDKFLLDVVPFGEPMIYIAQQGRPRIVLFGRDVQFERPAFVSTWSDRLMITTEVGTDPARVYFLPVGGERPLIQQSRTGLVDMVEFFAKRPLPGDPRPGLNMSYSEVVGALHEIFKANATLASFATETDKLKAQLLAASSSLSVAERPETVNDREVVVLNKPAILETKTVPQGVDGDKPTIVPIPPPTAPKK